MGRKIIQIYVNGFIKQYNSTLTDQDILGRSDVGICNLLPKENL